MYPALAAPFTPQSDCILDVVFNVDKLVRAPSNYMPGSRSTTTSSVLAEVAAQLKHVEGFDQEQIERLLFKGMARHTLQTMPFHSNSACYSLVCLLLYSQLRCRALSIVALGALNRAT
tara:strand:- start:1777 stop:2130 length:354 start_codon:yes stop_codon:yes gene_type:complete